MFVLCILGCSQQIPVYHCHLHQMPLYLQQKEKTQKKTQKEYYAKLLVLCRSVCIFYTDMGVEYMTQYLFSFE